jgi:arylsulfatase A-like enzyme
MLYQAAVRQIDASIGRVLETLSANALDDETAVIVAGDHGEEFQEHGHLAHYPKLYDELIRVPLIVDVPGHGHQRIEKPIGLDAIPPTVTDLFDVHPPDAWTGASVLPSVRGDESPTDDPVVSVTVRDGHVTSQPIPRSLSDGDLLVSARTTDWTYIENVDTGEQELYHRPTDSGQQTNLVPDLTAEQQDTLDELARSVADHVSTIRDDSTAPTADDEQDSSGDSIDGNLEARLSALGYR